MLNKFIRNLIENYKIFTYDTALKVDRITLYSSVITFLFTFFYLIYSYGFNTPSQNLTHIILKLCLLFYVLRYIIKYLYRINESSVIYIRKNLFEFILLCLSLFLIWPHTILVIDISILLIKLFLFIYLILDLAKFISSYLTKIKISHQLTLLLSFVILIFLGAILLMLPEMALENKKVDFLTALFLSVSASCVTGLSVVDITEVFSAKGQTVIMVLMQLGGMNIIMFASFFNLLIRSNNNIKYQNILKENLNSTSILDNKFMLKKIFFFIFFIELLGAFLIYLTLPKNMFNGNFDMIFHSVFHSISAFNNAGFSSFPPEFNANAFRELYLLQIIIIFLITFGGIGFPVVNELLKNNIFKKYSKSLSIHTQIVIKTSLFFILVGVFLFFILEQKNTLINQNFFQKTVTSLFQSVTTRTAGFSTVDISNLKISTLIFFMFWMFAGASPGSTGGGIKTTTVYILYRYGLTFFAKKSKIEYQKNFISFNSVNKAMVTFTFAVFFICVTVFLLSISEKNIPFHELIFETVSAFATVGLSTGITPELSTMGKIIIIFNMFIGRLGLITLGFSIINKVKKDLDYNYKETHLIIG